MRIAVLEPNVALREKFNRWLRDLEHTPILFETLDDLLDGLSDIYCDLLLLDFDPPNNTSFDTLAWTKTNLKPSPPVIIVTARHDDEDVANTLASGADDYIDTPVRASVFKARVEATLRRRYGFRATSSIETYGDYAFTVASEQLSIRDVEVNTTSKTFNLALVLFRNLGRPISREYILKTVWTSSIDSGGRTLDVHVAQVRRQLRLIPENGYRLSSVYRFGYRLERITGWRPILLTELDL